VRKQSRKEAGEHVGHRTEAQKKENAGVIEQPKTRKLKKKVFPTLELKDITFRR
jgi:hypothetical protein